MSGALQAVVYPVVVLLIGAIIGGCLKTLAEWRGKARDTEQFWRDFKRDWKGEAGRPGVTPRPGVMERLQMMERTTSDLRAKVADIHHEVKPNGGRSIKDQLNRLDPDYPEPITAGPADR